MKKELKEKFLINGEKQDINFAALKKLSGVCLKVEKIGETHSGKRLAELIKEKDKTRKDFVDNITEWLQDNNLDSEGKQRIESEDPTLYPGRISEWIKGKRKMRPRTIEVLAKYFGVDQGYLNCTQVEKHKTDSLDPEFIKRIEEEQDKREKEEFFRQFLLYYTMDVFPSSAISYTDKVKTVKFIEKDKVKTDTEKIEWFNIYQATGLIQDEVDMYEFVLPNQDTAELSAEQLKEIMDKTAEYIELLVYKAKINSNQETD